MLHRFRPGKGSHDVLPAVDVVASEPTASPEVLLHARCVSPFLPRCHPAACMQSSPGLTRGPPPSFSCSSAFLEATWPQEKGATKVRTRFSMLPCTHPPPHPPTCTKTHGLDVSQIVLAFFFLLFFFAPSLTTCLLSCLPSFSCVECASYQIGIALGMDSPGPASEEELHQFLFKDPWGREGPPAQEVRPCSDSRVVLILLVRCVWFYFCFCASNLARI